MRRARKLLPEDLVAARRLAVAHQGVAPRCRAMGVVLALLRTAAGQTQAQAARGALIDPSYLSLVERGERAISDERLARLARHYGLGSEDLRNAAYALLCVVNPLIAEDLLCRLVVLGRARVRA